MQTHGDADQSVPLALGRQLFESASEPKQLVVVPNGGHNDPPSEENFAIHHQGPREFEHAVKLQQDDHQRSVTQWLDGTVARYLDGTVAQFA